MGREKKNIGAAGEAMQLPRLLPLLPPAALRAHVRAMDAALAALPREGAGAGAPLCAPAAPPDAPAAPEVPSNPRNPFPRRIATAVASPS